MSGNRRGKRTASAAAAEANLRVIGGRMRGRSFRYNGDPGLRPMKDRVREAVFNLIGPAAKGCQVVDLFGGTGAMAFEAISRGATQAIVIERKFPNIRTIEENAAALGVAEQVDARAGDTFLLYETLELGSDPWLVFCCPPYEFYGSRTAELDELVKWFCDASPPESLIVVEADQQFDPGRLPRSGEWDVRTYPPAVISLFQKLAAS